ncbi:hypothetical protein ACFRI7_32215 [Streptomyces sp. NPDC056716]|uniref:hypothetical protein n=1 Tax=unclassified Streptomyces TaxID=2593676 RepID=UPI0036B4044A
MRRLPLRGRDRRPATGDRTPPADGTVSGRTLRRECERLLAQMPLPTPFTLDGLIAAIESERGRHIDLVPIPDRLLATTDVFGLWLRLDAAPIDMIFYVQGATGFHRQQIILHELAHLWCDDAADTDAAQLAALLPGVPPDFLESLAGKGQVMARHRYDSPVERRAEMLAGLLQHQAYAIDHIEDATLRTLDEDLTRLNPRTPTPRKPRARH